MTDYFPVVASNFHIFTILLRLYQSLRAVIGVSEILRASAPSLQLLQGFTLIAKTKTEESYKTYL